MPTWRSTISVRLLVPWLGTNESAPSWPWRPNKDKRLIRKCYKQSNHLRHDRSLEGSLGSTSGERKTREKREKLRPDWLCGGLMTQFQRIHDDSIRISFSYPALSQRNPTKCHLRPMMTTCFGLVFRSGSWGNKDFLALAFDCMKVLTWLHYRNILLGTRSKKKPES